jgi:hypothetical protein
MEGYVRVGSLVRTNWGVGVVVGYYPVPASSWLGALDSTCDRANWGTYPWSVLIGCSEHYFKEEDMRLLSF